MNKERLMTKTSPFRANTLQIQLCKVKNLSLIVALFITVFITLSAKTYATEQQAQTLMNNNKTSVAFISRSMGQSSPKTVTSDITKRKTPENLHKVVGKTRTEHLLLKQQTNKNRLQSTQHKALIQSTNNNNVLGAPATNYTANYHDFSIYRAFSYLLDDIDGDEFYQSFSIVFDADVYHLPYAEVYAELYLRKDGVPWIHYYSTDIFSLYGESEEDEFEVSTTLEQGFTAGFYDVLIDLYEANSNELVVSYSSDDDNALYALPLESSDYDQIYVTEVEVIYGDGGSFSFFALFMVCTIMLFRYTEFSHRKRPQ